jgi:hypothetical protein
MNLVRDGRYTADVMRKPIFLLATFFLLGLTARAEAADPMEQSTPAPEVGAEGRSAGDNDSPAVPSPFNGNDLSGAVGKKGPFEQIL